MAIGTWTGTPPCAARQKFCGLEGSTRNPGAFPPAPGTSSEWCTPNMRPMLGCREKPQFEQLAPEQNMPEWLDACLLSHCASSRRLCAVLGRNLEERV